MANRKRNGEDHLPPALPTWVALLLVGALLINTTEDQLERAAGAVLVVIVIIWVLADFVALIDSGKD